MTRVSRQLKLTTQQSLSKYIFLYVYCRAFQERVKKKEISDPLAEMRGELRENSLLNEIIVLPEPRFSGEKTIGSRRRSNGDLIQLTHVQIGLLAPCEF